MPKTCILILLDGLGDRSHSELGHKTPLQAAHTPSLDRLAAMGGTGLYHATKFGQPLPSENAHFAIFGNKKKEFPGRGPLEALGADVSLGPDDVAMLAHFTSLLPTLHNELILKYDRICGTPSEIDGLYSVLGNFTKDGISIDLHKTDGMFSVLTMRGDVSPHITDSNPMVDGRFVSEIKPLNSFKDDPAAIRTAEVLTDYLRWAYHQLSSEPQNKLRMKQQLPTINGLVTQRAGQLKPCVSMRDRYGLHGLIIASGVMYKGLSQYIGMNFHKARDTRDPGHDLARRIEHAAGCVDEFDFIHVHTKAPDQAAHTKSPTAKVKAIESLDKGLAESIDSLIDNDDVLLVVTADHSTPSCGTLIHSGEPVPVMFVGNGVRRDAVQQFDEISVAGGALGSMRGDEIMYMILNYLDKARLIGIHDTPMKQEFWPGDYEPFLIDPK